MSENEKRAGIDASRAAQNEPAAPTAKEALAAELDAAQQRAKELMAHPLQRVSFEGETLGEALARLGAPPKQQFLTPAEVPSTRPPQTPEQDRFEEAAGAAYAECFELLMSKHRDYGPHNIARSPGGPLNGLRVRMHDKQARINNLIDTGASPEHESLRDSFRDLANYALIAMLVIDGHWPQ